jgi:branched-chain amino acid transport system ATP-binding protein
MLLEAKEIRKSFGGLTAVDGVNFSLEEGHIESIIGPNGAGKTTFFNIISGNDHPDQGQVIFDGIDMTRLEPDRTAACGIYRSADRADNLRGLFTMRTVCDNSGISGIFLDSRLFY